MNACDICTERAEFELDIEEAQELTPRACADHLGLIARAAIEVWSEHGVICVMPC